MYYWIKAILTPSCWVQNKPYSAVWDAKLLDLMESDRFSSIGQYTANIGGMCVWIENHPYASFTPNSGPKVRARRATILRAYDKLLRDYFGVHNAEVS